MKDLFALLLGGDLFSQNQSFGFPKDGDPNWSKVVESIETKSHIISKEIWTSKDGGIRMERVSTEIKQKENVDILKLKLKKAVAKEDYEQAALLRDKIKMLES